MSYRFGNPIRYYDPQGLPGEREYTCHPVDERRVAYTDGLTFEGKQVFVSTILLPNMVVTGQGPEFDKPFETQIRAPGADLHFLLWRYPTRADAEEAHEALVTLLRSGVGLATLEELARPWSATRVSRGG